MSSAIFSFLPGSPLPQKASRQRQNTKMRRLSPESHLSENEVVRFVLLLLLRPNCLLCLLVLDWRLMRLVRGSIGTTETQERRRKWTSAGRVKTVRAPESGETTRGWESLFNHLTICCCCDGGDGDDDDNDPHLPPREHRRRFCFKETGAKNNRQQKKTKQRNDLLKKTKKQKN